MGTIYILLIMAVVFWYMSRNKKRDQERRQAEREAAMVPGTWMVTTAGYYGRFVDRDGDVVILENLDGQETLWSLGAIVGPSQPPFAESIEDEAENSDPLAKADESSESEEQANTGPVCEEDSDNPEADLASQKE